MSSHVNLDLQLRDQPFSRFGSPLSINHYDRPPDFVGVFLLTHVGGVERRQMLRLRLVRDGEVVECRDRFDAAVLVLEPEDGPGRVELLFESDWRLRVRGEGVALRLSLTSGGKGVGYDAGEAAAGGRRYAVNLRPSRCRVGVEPLRGSVQLDTPLPGHATETLWLTIAGGDDGFDAMLDVHESTWPRGNDHSPFDALAETTRGDFARFCEPLLKGHDDPATRLTAARAVFLNWASVLHPMGLLRRPGMLMSNRHMDNIWAWDHCFNAIALAGVHDDLAWDQWAVMFDHQDEHGCIPDALNPTLKHYNFAKPPIHGWVLRQMLRRSPRLLDEPRRREALRWLTRWTAWWLDHRRMTGEPLPHALHGNDTGWDNSTLFDRGTPLVTPDLAAFLALQCEAVAELTADPGQEEQAKHWGQEAQRLVDTLLEQLWRGDRFVARLLPGGNVVEADSLLTCIPLVLGRRLPPEVQTALVRRVRRHLTDHGLATEPVTSPRYKSDGYWRGPIWAPSTFLIIDGLRQIGEDELADDIAARFCRTCARSGFAENFDAMTGEPLSDPAYTWTSSVYLLLGRGDVQRRVAEEVERC